MTGLTDQQRQDLEVARGLVRAGVPIFLGRADPSRPTGYAEALGWQRSVPDESVVDAWVPGMALCAVMGHVLDLIDVDPRSGGRLDQVDPPVNTDSILFSAVTPSGGTHLFVAPLRVESRDGAYPGIDVKSGTEDGAGRGYAFIAPTVRASKVDGTEHAYRWVHSSTEQRVRDVQAYAGPRLSGGLAAIRQRVLDLRSARTEGGPPRRLARSAAAAEWGRACERLTEQVRVWAANGWGGDAHAGLLEASRHLVLLSPEHAEAAYHYAFRRAGAEPDEADLAKLDSALDKYTEHADVVVPDDQLGANEGFWVGAQGPPPFATTERPAAHAPPGTFDFLTPERIRGRRPPEPARYGRFGGDRALFYAEGVHWLQGESESGKSWVLLCHVLDVLRDGRPVLLADYEDHESAVLERLLQLGATEAELGRLVYVAAADVSFDAMRAHLLEEVDRNYGLYATDGVTAALSSAGLSGRDEQELTRWVDLGPRLVRSSQQCDHMVKATDERAGMAIGTQAKKSVVTGTAFEVACTEKFGRGTTGEVILRLQKDKRGGVRALVRDGVRLRFTSEPGTGAVSLLVPSAQTRSERVAQIEHERAVLVLALVARLENAGIPASTKRGANGRAWAQLAELSGSAGDKGLHTDAWQTHLARSGVPEATYPAYVRRHLQDHQEDHQEVQEIAMLTPFTTRLTSAGDVVEDHQEKLLTILSGDHQEVRRNGVRTSNDQAKQ